MRFSWSNNKRSVQNEAPDPSAKDAVGQFSAVTIQGAQSNDRICPR